MTTIDRPTRIALAAIVAGLLLVPGCATVRPYEREHVASRIMTFDADAKALARRTKSLEAREGSTGGVGGAGGGCACSN
ncbi:MAG: DUF4266 domain-containing protein [Candidatus Eisenbacteria bacterium]|nr:DUF4266 domain-containing protein [Candidatus Eisenbacteria bacterium]